MQQWIFTGQALFRGHMKSLLQMINYDIFSCRACSAGIRLSVWPKWTDACSPGIAELVSPVQPGASPLLGLYKKIN
jgi:hypothetical protein